MCLIFLTHAFIDDFEHISKIDPVFLLLELNK